MSHKSRVDAQEQVGQRGQRRPKFYVRNFIKELKRVRWNANKDLLKSFLTTLIFIIITTMFFAGVASVAQSIFVR